jgi:hypothetical protein
MSDSRTENAIGQVRKAAGKLSRRARRRNVPTAQAGTMVKADVAADMAREKLTRA